MFYDILTFQQNGISTLMYLISTNAGVLFLSAGVLGNILLDIREAIDASVREEQNII